MIEPTSSPGPWWKRLLWMVAIWAGSVAILFLVASILRWWIV